MPCSQVYYLRRLFRGSFSEKFTPEKRDFRLMRPTSGGAAPRCGLLACAFSYGMDRGRAITEFRPL